jgi:hypothetical protein
VGDVLRKFAPRPRCGTLPDFGNSRIGFNDAGEETHTDYRKMMDIVVKKHKYNGYVGIEYEGGKISEADGIKATKKLLEKIRAGMTA